MMRLAVVLTGVLLAAIGLAWAADEQSAQPETESKSATTQPGGDTFKSDMERVSYAIGMDIGNSFKKQSIDVTPDILAQGMKDVLAGKTLMTEEQARKAIMEWQQKLRAKMQAKQSEEANANKTKGEAFLAENKSKAGVVTTASGLQYKVIEEGDGPKPIASDTVKVNYKGTLLDGTEFDSSEKHGGPATFQANRVIKGWTEALQLMKVGSKYQLWIPSDLAYGPRGTPSGEIGGNSLLIFEVELLGIEKPEKDGAASQPAGELDLK